MGLVLVILAGYRSGTELYNYVWNFIAGGVGFFLIIVAIGDLLASDQMDTKAANLHFLGSVLMGVGPVHLMYTQLALNAQLGNWWAFPVAGVAFLIGGVVLILSARFLRPSS